MAVLPKFAGSHCQIICQLNPVDDRHQVSVNPYSDNDSEAIYSAPAALFNCNGTDVRRFLVANVASKCTSFYSFLLNLYGLP